MHSQRRWFGQRTQLAGLLLLGCVSLALAADKAAQKAAEVSDDFLEYLGSLEGDDDSWQDFTVEAVATRDTTKSASSVTPDAKSETKLDGKSDGKQDTRDGRKDKPMANSSSSLGNAMHASASMNGNAASKATGKADK
ncbi:MAG: hypothetical protein QM808_09885 [Steroidobacteraceae bacterium]